MENERGEQIGEESVRDGKQGQKKIEKLRVDEEGKCNYKKDWINGERRERWKIEGVDRNGRNSGKIVIKREKIMLNCLIKITKKNLKDWIQFFP